MTEPFGKRSCCLPASSAGQARLSNQPTEPKPAQVCAGRPEDAQADFSQEWQALDGGWFRMGADDGPHPEDGEGPSREVFVDAFSIAPTAVSNAEFAAFVAHTGYQTLAEQLGDSYVFAALCDADGAYTAPQQAPWWRRVPGACWQHPEGPHSDIRERLDHPVVHVAKRDVLAYCAWSGTRLPSEAEWEFASRGGVARQPFPWGHELEQGGVHHANVWQGEFPHINTVDDGYLGTAPVRAYEANAYGMFNTVGNVWEWVDDMFTTLHSPRPTRNPKGPLNGQHGVAKGGSYLCHISYCARYRNSSRQALQLDTTTGNLGFRVARTQAA